MRKLRNEYKKIILKYIPNLPQKTLRKKYIREQVQKISSIILSENYLITEKIKFTKSKSINPYSSSTEIDLLSVIHPHDNPLVNDIKNSFPKNKRVSLLNMQAEKDNGSFVESIAAKGKYHYQFIVGYPEDILHICDLTDSELENCYLQVFQHANRGEMTLCVAYREVAAKHNTQRFTLSGLSFFKLEPLENIASLAGTLRYYGISVYIASSKPKHYTLASIRSAFPRSKTIYPYDIVKKTDISISRKIYSNVNKTKLHQLVDKLSKERPITIVAQDKLDDIVSAIEYYHPN